jgi:hypothetical protein
MKDGKVVESEPTYALGTPAKKAPAKAAAGRR